jgi:hypothetical protein
MIANDQELQATMERIAWLQKQLTHLRKTENNSVNYRAASSGFLAEIDRMQLEIREYFRFLPAEMSNIHEQGHEADGGRVVGVS